VDFLPDFDLHRRGPVAYRAVLQCGRGGWCSTLTATLCPPHARARRECPAVAALVRNPRLAATAAALLGAPRLRLYQDCAFVKRPGFGATNWHSDLRMAPLDTNAFVTAWIPLRPIQARDRVRVYARACSRARARAARETPAGPPPAPAPRMGAVRGGAPVRSSPYELRHQRRAWAAERGDGAKSQGLGEGSARARERGCA